MINLRIVAVVATLAVALVAQTPVAPTAPEVPAAIKEARALNNAGKQDEAIAVYRRYLAEEPRSYDAHLGLGIALDLKGDYGEARRHLTRAIELAPPASKNRALRTMGMSYAFERDAKGAEKYHGQAYEAELNKQRYQQAAEVANELARVMLEARDVKGAEKWYRTGYDAALKKTDLKPTERALWDFRWHHAQARLAARRGKHDAAQQHVTEAKAALDKAENPDQAKYFPYLTGYVAFYAKDYPKAIAELQKADQEDPFIASLLAQAYEHSGDRAKALEFYRKALTANSHNPTNAYARPLARKKISELEKRVSGS